MEAALGNLFKNVSYARGGNCKLLFPMHPPLIVQIKIKIFQMLFEVNRKHSFRQSTTQTSLNSHRRWLEAWNFVFRKERDCSTCIYVQSGKNKGADQLRCNHAADLH